jgi:hypothetical protein
MQLGTGRLRSRRGGVGDVVCLHATSLADVSKATMKPPRTPRQHSADLAGEAPPRRTRVVTAPSPRGHAQAHRDLCPTTDAHVRHNQAAPELPRRSGQASRVATQSVDASPRDYAPAPAPGAALVGWDLTLCVQDPHDQTSSPASTTHRRDRVVSVPRTAPTRQRRYYSRCSQRSTRRTRACTAASASTSTIAWSQARGPRQVGALSHPHLGICAYPHWASTPMCSETKGHIFQR